MIKGLLTILFIIPFFVTAQVGLPAIKYVNSAIPFVPTDTSGLLTWFYADTLGLGDTDPVTEWTDLSGNVNDATPISNAPHYATGELDGKATVYFNAASSESMKVTNTSIIGGNTGLSVFIVVKQTSLATNQVYLTKWDYATDGTFALQTDDTNNDEVMGYFASGCTDAGGNNQHSTDADLTTNYFLLEYIYDGTQSNANRVKIYRNGTLLSISTNGTLPTSLTSCSATLKIGAFGGGLTRYFDGYFAEILIYDHTLTSTGRTSVENYIHLHYPSLW